MRRWLPRVLPWLITLLLILFWVRNGGDLGDLGAHLQEAKWRWLAAAVLAQFGAYGAVAWLNEIILRHYQVRVPRFRQYAIQYAMSFVEAALPSLAVSGLVLRVRLLMPYGASMKVATISTLLETLLIGFSVLLPGLVVIGFEVMDGADNQLDLAALLIGVVGLALAGVLVVGLRASRSGLALWQATRRGLAHWWDGWVLAHGPDRLHAWPSRRMAMQARGVVDEMRALLSDRPFPIAAALLLRTGCEAAALLFCFYAFGIYLPLLGLFLLYTITISVNTLGAAPGGMGLAEALLATIYIQFDITPELAAAVALTYRLSGYWLPRLLGALSWLWLERQHRVDVRLPEAE